MVSKTSLPVGLSQARQRLRRSLDLLGSGRRVRVLRDLSHDAFRRVVRDPRRGGSIDSQVSLGIRVRVVASFRTLDLQAGVLVGRAGRDLLLVVLVVGYLRFFVEGVLNREDVDDRRGATVREGRVEYGIGRRFLATHVAGLVLGLEYVSIDYGAVDLGVLICFARRVNGLNSASYS